MIILHTNKIYFDSRLLLNFASKQPNQDYEELDSSKKRKMNKKKNTHCLSVVNSSKIPHSSQAT